MNSVPIKLQALYKTASLDIAKVLPDIAVGVVILLVTWLIGAVAKRCIVRLAKRSKNHLYLYQLIGSTVMTVILATGIITALGTMGIDVAALVAGLGLVGFAVGFALKDTLSNLLSGFMVLFYQPFKAGDYIVVNKVEGRVINISLRYTVVQTDEDHTFVPNSTILSHPLTVKDIPKDA
jgi:small conductance mechanosensitive channel